MAMFKRGSKLGFCLCGLFATAIMLLCDNSASAQQTFSTTLLGNTRKIGSIELALKTDRSFPFQHVSGTDWLTGSDTTLEQPPVIRPIVFGAAAKVITQGLFLLSLPEDPNPTNIGFLNYLLFFADPALVAESVHAGNRRLGHLESVYSASFSSLILGGSLILYLIRELEIDRPAIIAASILMTDIVQLAFAVRTERRTALRRM